jgi:hypothetical protein
VHNRGQPNATLDEDFISRNIFDGDDLFVLLKGENPIHHSQWKLPRHKGFYLMNLISIAYSFGKDATPEHLGDRGRRKINRS